MPRSTLLWKWISLSLVIVTSSMSTSGPADVTSSVPVNVTSPVPADVTSSVPDDHSDLGEFHLLEHNKTHSILHVSSAELHHHSDIFVKKDVAEMLPLTVGSKDTLRKLPIASDGSPPSPTASPREDPLSSQKASPQKDLLSSQTASPRTDPQSVRRLPADGAAGDDTDDVGDDISPVNLRTDFRTQTTVDENTEGQATNGEETERDGDDEKTERETTNGQGDNTANSTETVNRDASDETNDGQTEEKTETESTETEDEETEDQKNDEQTGKKTETESAETEDEQVEDQTNDEQGEEKTETESAEREDERVEDQTNDEQTEEKTETESAETEDEQVEDQTSSSEEEEKEDEEDIWTPPAVVNGTVREDRGVASSDSADKQRERNVTTFALVMCGIVGATFVVLVGVWINRMRRNERIRRLQDQDDEEFTVFSANDTQYPGNTGSGYLPLR